MVEEIETEYLKERADQMEKKMIENFTAEEFSQLIKELKETGYEIKVNTKSKILRKEATAMFGGHPYITNELMKAIYIIADFATDNYEYRGKKGNRYHSTIVAEEKQNEYSRIVKGILEVLKPCYGKIGFQHNSRYVWKEPEEGDSL